MATLNKSIVDLPPEVILLRLSVKSLIRCKSVCKSWLSTISSPDFITSQLHHAIIASRKHPTLVNIINPRHRHFTPYGGGRRRRQLVDQALLGQEYLSTPPVVHCEDVPVPRCLLRVIGCCNGILCLSDDFVFYLWNPSIRQFKKLEFPKPHKFQYKAIPVGFGYDIISNDYKLLLLTYKYGNAGVQYVGVPLILQVYSLNDNSSKQFVGPILEKQLVPTNNIVVNGVLYFDGDDKMIFSFDLQKEVFGLIPFPSFIQRKRSAILDFEGSVAMVFESEPGKVDLWTLDIGKLSWTKKFNFDDHLDDSDTELWIYFYFGARQFCGQKLLKNGKYFVYDVLYDYEKKETKCFGLQNDVHKYGLGNDHTYLPFHSTHMYTETLVSFDGFKQVEMPQ